MDQSVILLIQYSVALLIEYLSNQKDICTFAGSKESTRSLVFMSTKWARTGDFSDMAV